MASGLRHSIVSIAVVWFLITPGRYAAQRKGRTYICICDGVGWFVPDNPRYPGKRVWYDSGSTLGFSDDKESCERRLRLDREIEGVRSSFPLGSECVPESDRRVSAEMRAAGHFPKDAKTGIRIDPPGYAERLREKSWRDRIYV